MNSQQDGQLSTATITRVGEKLKSLYTIHYKAVLVGMIFTGLYDPGNPERFGMLRRLGSIY